MRFARPLSAYMLHARRILCSDTFDKTGQNLSSPVAASQSLTVLLSDADATCLPSGENATALTRPEWPSRVCSGAPNADRHSKTQLDLERYAREVLTAQPRCRFVLGFTLNRSTIRLWEFDRLRNRILTS